MERLNRRIADVAAIALAVMMMVTILDIVLKNAFGRPIASAFEWVEISLAVMVFLGLPRVFRTEGNVVVDVIDHFVGARAVRGLKLVGALATIGFLLLVGYAMIEPALDTVRFPEAKPESGMPLWAIWIPILAGLVLSILGAAHVARRHLRSGPQE